MKERLVRMTQQGAIEGRRHSQIPILEWLGVPYARPPLHDLRWKAPRDPDPWDGILETKEFGNGCVRLCAEQIIGSEDCLYLHIWRPDDDRSQRPVLVFLHGGGNVSGSAQDFKGDMLARQTDSIIISVNYRLGVLGWMRHPALATGDPLDDSGNYGLLDIFQALHWVRANIHHFGGDRQNVTLGGHSAGGRNVMAALISPLGKDLFQKALVLSGGMTMSTPSAGEKKASDLVSHLLITEGQVSTTEEALQWQAEKPTVEIAAYLREKKATEFPTFIGDPAIKMEPFPHLFTDGYVIPQEGFQRNREGKHQQVAIILGCTADEFSLFAYFDPFFFNLERNKSRLGDQHKYRLYQRALAYGSKIYAGFNVDRTADWLMEDMNHPPVYAYRLAWGTGAGVVSEEIRELFGAPHGADIDFWTGHEEARLAELFPHTYYTDENRAGREKLQRIMIDYLRHFLHTGHPNQMGLPQWEPWQNRKETERILILDADHEQATVKMSQQDFSKEDIVQEMKDKLSEEEYELIVNHVFEQRFFWDTSY